MTSLERMRECNQSLQQHLVRLQSSAADPSAEVRQLRVELEAAQRASIAGSDQDAQATLFEHRDLLQRLQKLLPSLQARLSLERHRLEAELGRLRAAEGWAVGNRKTL